MTAKASSEPLQEYRCGVCGKLLFKGRFVGRVDVTCRKCQPPQIRVFVSE